MKSFIFPSETFTMFIFSYIFSCLFNKIATVTELSPTLDEKEQKSYIKKPIHLIELSRIITIP